MSRPFLATFPREIRNHIYAYVLASPSGVISLSPWTAEVARSLALLRTCHQIHRECKDIIWADTGLAARPPTQLSKRLEVSIHRRQTRHVRIFLELLDRDELDWVVKSAHILLDWHKERRLSAIILTANWEKPCGVEEFEEISNLRTFGENVDGRLLQESKTSSTMLINTGWPRFTHWGKQRWLREMLLDTNVADKLQELHAIFGGTLGYNGLIYFNNGQQRGDLRLNPRDGEIVIIPAVIKEKNLSRA